MPLPESSDDPDVWLTRFNDHLKVQRYSRCARCYESAARRFFDYLQMERLTVHTVQPCDVQKHLRALKHQRKAHSRAELSDSWRNLNRSALHMLLKLVHGTWPLDPVPRTEQELFRHEVIDEYRGWMKDLRGLATTTQHNRCIEALRFLEWLGARSQRESLSTLTVLDIDAYVRWRVTSLRRASKKVATVNVRSFVRHLHGSGRIRDLSSAVIGPKLYAFEGIPSALRADEIEKLLKSVRQDR